MLGIFDIDLAGRGEKNPYFFRGSNSFAKVVDTARQTSSQVIEVWRRLVFIAIFRRERNTNIVDGPQSFPIPVHVVY